MANDAAKYQQPVKATYRETVWNLMLEGETKESLRTKTALILSGPEGLEIPLLLKRGFKQENIIAVDSNPANVATAKRMNGTPKVQAYGRKLSEAVSMMSAEKKSVDFANLDFCGNMTGDLLDEVRLCVRSSAFTRTTLTVTYLKGRELAVLKYLMAVSNAHDRVSLLTQSVAHNRPHGSVEVVGTGLYKNGPSPMEWVSMKLDVNPIRVKSLEDTAVAISEGADIYNASEIQTLLSEISGGIPVSLMPAKSKLFDQRKYTRTRRALEQFAEAIDVATRSSRRARSKNIREREQVYTPVWTSSNQWHFIDKWSKVVVQGPIVYPDPTEFVVFERVTDTGLRCPVLTEAGVKRGEFICRNAKTTKQVYNNIRMLGDDYETAISPYFYRKDHTQLGKMLQWWVSQNSGFDAAHYAAMQKINQHIEEKFKSVSQPAN